MNTMARNDWKRHSAPFDFGHDYTDGPPSVMEMFDQAMEAFTTDVSRQRSATVGRDRKKTITPTIMAVDSVELSTDQYTPGLLRVFGETLLPGVQYKSVLASCRSTAQELVKQALERFGLSPVDYRKFVLCDVVGRYDGGGGNEVLGESANSGKWERVYARILTDRDKPLLLQKFWKPIEGYSRRYELHERTHVMDVVGDDDTYGLNKNVRKILMSKLRPGAIPLFDAATMGCHLNGPNTECSQLTQPVIQSAQTATPADTGASNSQSLPPENHKLCSDETGSFAPSKQPFFLNVRGFDVRREKTMYVIKSKKFSFGCPSKRNKTTSVDLPKFRLFAPDIEHIHCNVKVYKFKKSSDKRKQPSDRCNYFLELDPLGNNVSVNGHRLAGRAIIKSGDLINIGIYYVLIFKDCSGGFDIPLCLPWLPVPELSHMIDSEGSECELRLNLPKPDEECKSSTDDSMDASIAERMQFPYTKEKEEDLVKYICAIVQQHNTSKTYPLSLAFLLSMCIEYASRTFERRQLKHLFLRVLFTVRENVAETAKTLSASKFKCGLLDSANQTDETDQKLERLLMWISNCVQLLLFLKHTFQLPDDPVPEQGTTRGRGDRTQRKDDNAKHALGQLVTGLEEIIMFCFQQCVYTITKSLHPVLPAMLDSNPFSDVNSEQCSMEDVTRMFGTLAEVTHAIMLHEGITRQMFTYLFFFCSTNLFNKLIIDSSGVQYYSWATGVRIRANLSQLEDWATQNGLEDEFGQMFERLLAASELLATSKNKLVKYEWNIMKDHYQPLTPGQLHHVLTHYQMGDKPPPAIWSPSPEDMDIIANEDLRTASLCNHPPFALPDNCGLVDLIRTPEDQTFWNHLRRLQSLYGVAEDDSDSGFSISNTPRGSQIPRTEMEGSFFEEGAAMDQPPATNTKRQGSRSASPQVAPTESQTTKPHQKKLDTSPWPFRVPKTGTGVCTCSDRKRNLSRSRDCSEAECEGHHPNTQSLIADLARDETRDNLESGERYKESKDKVIAAIQSRSYRLNVSAAKQKCCKTEVKDKRANRNSVENCSALILSRPKQDKIDRCESKVLSKDANSQRSQNRNTIATTMFGTPKHTLSESFVMAIERGYDTDGSLSCDTDDNLSPVKDHSDPKCTFYEKKTHIDHNSNMLKRITAKSNACHKQDMSVNSHNDEVFIEESIDTFYKGLVNKNMACALPLINSSEHVAAEAERNRMGNQAHRLRAVSFDAPSSRRSSIELAKNKLYVHNCKCADNGTETNSSATDANRAADTSETFPPGMFIEVSENTLASRKRHGSSLNVLPTSNDNSPRFPVPLEGPGVDEERKMSPCPLYTVYLTKSDGGLGLGLIDGLHTPLRLAGIYVRKILPDSPAAGTGCLQVGDRIIAVDGKSVIGADYQSTMNAIRDTGDTLALLVARGNESMATKVTATEI